MKKLTRKELIDLSLINGIAIPFIGTAAWGISKSEGMLPYWSV